VDAPEPDLVGFSIEVKSPGSADFEPLRNRLDFSYDKPVDQAVDGYRNYSSSTSRSEISLGAFPLRAERRDVHLSRHQAVHAD
jgi:hypothetical protein